MVKCQKKGIKVTSKGKKNVELSDVVSDFVASAFKGFSSEELKFLLKVSGHCNDIVKLNKLTYRYKNLLTDEYIEEIVKLFEVKSVHNK